MSVTFVTDRFGQRTTTDAESWSVPLSVVVTLAVLLIVAHEAGVVGLVMCTDLDASSAERARSCRSASADAPIEQPASEFGASIVQLRPALAGRMSVTVTLVALPGPELVTVDREADRLAGVDGPASAVFSMSIAPVIRLLMNVHVVTGPALTVTD